MSTVAIRAVLEKRLAAMVGRPADIQWELAKTVFVPPPGLPYLRNWLLPAAPFNFGGLSTRRRLSGVFQVDVLYPYAERENAQPMADAVAAWFPQGFTDTANSVTTAVDRTPEVKSGRVEGDKWVIPVRVTYFANI